ncbi:MAG: L-threonylcarbamoyladenylate synthase [Candidatus Nanohaloarchaea archaeon]
MKETEEAKKTIEEGGLIIYPTETAYAIGGNALDEKVIERVYEAKQRPRSKGLTVIVDSLETVEKYAELSESEKALVDEFMPGPLTLVVEKKDKVPDSLNESFVFRVSSSPIARELAERPLIATSANVSGGKTSYSVDEISDELLEKADFVLDRGKLPRGPTSTIAEIRDGEIYIHREGPVKQEEIEAALDDRSLHI